MSIEKSCGAIVYRSLNTEIEFLAVRSKTNGHWGFPKGHMEKYESEQETAIREVFEETGLNVTLTNGFKTEIEYTLPNGILKEVIFFIGCTTQKSVHIQEEEIQEFKWLNYEDMLELLSFENSKNVLTEVIEFINKNNCFILH